ncbi:MAG: Crp/Fnr family transcriptional regulator [Spirochaetales bacterium]
MSLLALKRIDLFKVVSAKVLEDWLKGFHPFQREYHKGSYLLHQGKPYTELCCILAGEVSAEIQDYSGRVLKVETLKAFEALATAVLFSPDRLLPVSVVAQTEVTALWVPRSEVLRLCSLSPQFLESLLSDMGARVSFLAQKIRFLQFSTIRKKIAEYLLSQMRVQESRVLKLPHSREMLSELFGVTRPALSRVFSELCKEKVLRSQGRNCTVMDPARLRAMAEEEE